MLKEVYSGDIVVGDIGAVVGSHAGVGTIGVAFRVAN
jgi:fatty acid-binding protein DegV